MKKKTRRSGGKKAVRWKRMKKNKAAVEKMVVQDDVNDESVWLKDFEDLSFTDDYMFCQTLINNPELCKNLAEMIIGRKISRIVSVQGQKSIKALADGKGVRFDVCLEGEEEICDIEMQNTTDYSMLPKRSRYYQSVNDVSMLAKGKDYTNLKKSYILFLCKLKPFKDRCLHKYTFRNICIEDPTLEMGDETEKIFMTPDGTADDISEEVKGLMSYMTDNTASTDFTKKLDDAIAAIKAGEGWRIEYMQFKEKMEAQFNAGEKKGRKEGRVEGIKEGEKRGVDITLDVIDKIKSGEKDYTSIAKDCDTSVDTVKKIAENCHKE